MDGKHFLSAYEVITRNLVNLDVNRAFNSIGSNIFLEFGNEQEIVFRNGEKRIQKDWSIWISHASWRLTQEGVHIIGSGDSSIAIQPNIQQLMGKRFQNLKFISSFLEVQFNFDEGYQLTTFFNGLREDQWTVFLPNLTNISIDCPELGDLNHIQKLSEGLPIHEKEGKSVLLERGISLTKILYSQDEPILEFDHSILFNLGNSAWRIEQAETYVVGNLDDNHADLHLLVGKNLKEIQTTRAMTDVQLHFEDDYILNIFSCSDVIPYKSGLTALLKEGQDA